MHTDSDIYEAFAQPGSRVTSTPTAENEIAAFHRSFRGNSGR
jgi:hypothetical protein